MSDEFDFDKGMKAVGSKNSRGLQMVIFKYRDYTQPVVSRFPH
jgi:hypothetical protein